MGSRKSSARLSHQAPHLFWLIGEGIDPTLAVYPASHHQPRAQAKEPWTWLSSTVLAPKFCMQAIFSVSLYT